MKSERQCALWRGTLFGSVRQRQTEAVKTSTCTTKDFNHKRCLCALALRSACGSRNQYRLLFIWAYQLERPSWFSSGLSLWGLFWCQALCVLYILQHSFSINSRPWICGAQTSHEDSRLCGCWHIYRQQSRCVQSRIVSHAHSGLVKL